MKEILQEDLLFKLYCLVQNLLKRVLLKIKVGLICLCDCADVGVILGRKPYDNYLVRTDPQTRKITSMFSTSQAGGQNMAVESQSQSLEMEYETVSKERVPIKLGSVRELREEVMERAHNGINH